jgi:hypothetical protein
MAAHCAIATLVWRQAQAAADRGYFNDSNPFERWRINGADKRSHHGLSRNETEALGAVAHHGQPAQ